MALPASAPAAPAVDPAAALGATSDKGDSGETSVKATSASCNFLVERMAVSAAEAAANLCRSRQKREKVASEPPY